MANTLRLALIRQRYTPFGGAERFVEQALNALQKESNIEITLITRKWNGSENPNIKKIICNPFFIGRLWRDWSFVRCACRVVQQGNFNLVQSHERVPCCDIFRAGDGVHRQWLYQRSYTQSWWKRFIANISPYHRYLLWQEKNMFEKRTLKTIIINSTQTGAEIRRYFPKSTARLRLIYNSIDTNKFNPISKLKYRNNIRNRIGLTDDSTAILFIGSGYTRKGVPQLLTAINELPPHYHLIIIGKDSKQKKFEKICSKMKLSERVHFLGPQQDTVPYYSAADIFALPTLYDPLPNSVLEAMSCELPVIVSNSSGAKELISNGIEGYTQDPLDTNKLRKNILLISKLNNRNIIGKNARRKVMDLSPRKLVSELVKLYKEEMKIN